MIIPLRREHIATDLTELWVAWKDAISQKEEIWDDCDKHYVQNYLDTTDYENYEWRCKTSRPIAQETADTVSAAIHNALFPANDDYFQIKGDDPIGRKYAADMQKEFKKVLFKSRFVSKMEPFIKQLCVVGNAAGAVYHQTTPRARRRWQNQTMVRYKAHIADFPVFKHQNIYDVAFPPNIEEYDETVPRIHRVEKSLSDLKARKDLYIGVNELKSKKKVFSDLPASKRDLQDERFGINKQRKINDGDVELLTFFGDVKIGKKNPEEAQMIVCADREKIIRHEESPYWCGNPHIFGRYSSVPGQFYGRGVVEPILGLAELIDTFSCQKADVINLILGGFWAIAPDAHLDLMDLTARPQGVILLDDVDHIKSLVPSANPTLGFAEINDLKVEADASSGASKFTQGIPVPGRRTASEALLIGQGSSSRFNNIIVNIGEQAAEPALNIMLQEWFQFHAYGNPNIPDEAWEGSYYVEFNGAKQSVIRELTMQMFLHFLDILLKNQTLMEYVDPEKLLKTLTNLFSVDAETILKTDFLFGNQSNKVTPEIYAPTGNEISQFGGTGPQTNRIMEGLGR